MSVIPGGSEERCPAEQIGLATHTAIVVSAAPACEAPKRMAARRRFMFLLCGRGKVGEVTIAYYVTKVLNRSVPCVAVTVLFCYLSDLGLQTRRLSLESPWLLTFDCAFRNLVNSLG